MEQLDNSIKKSVIMNAVCVEHDWCLQTSSRVHYGYRCDLLNLRLLQQCLDVRSTCAAGQFALSLI